MCAEMSEKLRFGNRNRKAAEAGAAPAPAGRRAEKGRPFSLSARVEVLAEGVRIYAGHFEEIPIGEEFMLSKSMELFGDPEPCSIHRGAVRTELLRELNRLFQGGERPDSAEGLELLRRCMDCGEITEILFL